MANPLTPTFITIDDITDNILICNDNHIEGANAFLNELALSFNLKPEEIRFPPRLNVKRLGIYYACKECALEMVGSDTTVMMDGKRTDDIYLQKYNLYNQLFKDLKSEIGFEDFAVDDVDLSGKKGIYILPIFRA